MNIETREIETVRFNPNDWDTIPTVLKCADEMFPGVNVSMRVAGYNRRDPSVEGYIDFFCYEKERVRIITIVVALDFIGPDGWGLGIYDEEEGFPASGEYTLIENSDDLRRGIIAILEKAGKEKGTVKWNEAI